MPSTTTCDSDGWGEGGGAASIPGSLRGLPSVHGMLTLGIVLVVLGLALLVAEAHLPTFGALGGTGVAALVVGAVIAATSAGGGLGLVLALGVGSGVVAAGLLYIMVTRGAAVARGRAQTGAESLVGHIGVLRSSLDPLGQVFVDGALWRARPSLEDEGAAELRAGDPVVVERVRGLTLSVRKAEEWELMT
jgi:membrane-bound ClpP family serine protease